MKPVVMLPEQWDRVWKEIKKREKPSTWLSRTKMRETLGFTNRDHDEYIDRDKAIRKSDRDSWFDLDLMINDRKVFQHTVRLDFYDEQKRVMFLLKYGDYINAGQD